MKRTLLILAAFVACYSSYAQSQITTTGNNLINSSNPYAADIVIGSDAGTRHDASIMWWSNASASRISNTADVFYMSVWNMTIPNVALAASFGASSYFQGNVGVGTASPAYKFDVTGQGRFTTGAYVNDGQAFGVVSAVGITWANNTLIYKGYNPAIGGDYAEMLVPGGSLYAANLRLLSNGNVGIGTANPDQKLSVKGTIHSQEVIVDMNVLPDYVFKPAYHLPTLTEIKTYIDQNHHLPEMPSAEKVAKDGLSLGDMNAKLLKKVEELTLYLIDKDNQIVDQQKVNQSQQKEIDELKQQVSTLIKSKP
jgi:hypothetical protein